MRNALQISAITLAALLAAGCSTNNQQAQQMEARLSATETSVARAHARADEAYRMAEEAMAAAQTARPRKPTNALVACWNEPAASKTPPMA